jgi:hypothetical protein
MKKWSLFLPVLMLAVLAFGCGQNDTEPEGDSATVALGLGESYVYSIDEGPFSSYMAGKVIDEAQIGEKLEAVSVTAGWRNNTDGTMLSQETLRGAVYSIREVSTDVAVALKFLDKGDALTTTHYYVILNPDADLSAVSEYVIAPFAPNHPGDE